MSSALTSRLLSIALIGLGAACHAPFRVSTADDQAARRATFSAMQTAAFLPRLQLCEPGPIENATETWTPSEQDAQILDYLLSSALADSLNGSALSPNDYLFQYFGIVVSGQKRIFINAFHRAVAQSASGPADEWKRTPLQMCDAGTGAFQAVYLVAARNLGPLDFFVTLGIASP